MSGNKPRLVRLSAILTQLQSKRIVTAKDIAEKHNVSIRTVYRDIKTLVASGIPIITEEGKGYTFMEGYKIPPVMFTQEEANALITAEQIINKNKDQSFVEQFENAVTKVKAVLKSTQKGKAELLEDRIQVRGNYKNERTSNYLIQLQSTISSFQVIHINYTSLQNKSTERVIEPFALYTTQGNWILIAFCRLRNDFRAFRLDCIQKIKETNTYFSPHNITLQEYLQECAEKCKTSPDIPLTQGGVKFVSNQKNNKMQTVKIEPFKIIGVAIRTTNENGQSIKDIGAMWEKCIAQNIFDKIPNKVGYEMYSVYTDYEGDHTKPYMAIAGCKVYNLDEIPEGMIGKSFEGGTYQKSTAKGDLMDGFIAKEWNKIIAMDLDRTYQADFEIFGEKARNPADAEVEFYVGIK